ncbi:MAG: hypothetical protein WBH47_02275 [Streptosporangiaceae bacterium]
MSTLSSAAGPRSAARVSRVPADDTLPRWRAWVVAHPVGSSLLAGGVATQFATVFGIWFKGFGLPTLNWPTVNGALIIPTASPGAQYFAGWISHFADGVFFALLFALFFHPLVPLRNTILGNIIKAMLYGSVLAIISAAWFVPYVAYPHSGAGVFSSGFGWKLVFGIFLWHWIYGYFLGSVYTPLPRQPVVMDEGLPRSAPSAETTPVH